MNPTRRGMMLSLGAAAAATAVTARGRGAVSRIALTESLDLETHAFLRAVEAGDLGEVRRLLKSNPTLAGLRDARGLSAFILARLEGRTEVADELRSRIELDAIEAVLDENWVRFAELTSAEPELCHRVHPIGGTPLHAGALAGSRDLSRLRAAGCRVDANPAGGCGFTPARLAMECRTLSGARSAATDLLGNGADANAAQRDRDSILHGAVRRRSEILVKLAIRKGADPAAQDKNGRTALDLAEHLEWAEGARLLADHALLPRDHRASRWLFDATRQPIVRPDLSDVAQARQNEITGSSHAKLDRLRDLVGKDSRLVFSVSTDDELANEACAHTGNRSIIHYHLERGAPLSLPTAVALGDLDTIRFLLDRDPMLIHERGAHDFPLFWFVVLGGGGVEIAQLLHQYGAAVDQESLGYTALHWCARSDQAELAAWLIEHGADIEAIGFKFDRDGRTPLQIARTEECPAIVAMLEKAGARR